MTAAPEPYTNGAGHEKRITFVGLDAHKVAIKVAMALAGQIKPVEWQLANEKSAVRRMVKKVQRLSGGGEGSLLLRRGAMRLEPPHRARESAVLLPPQYVRPVWKNDRSFEPVPELQAA